MVYKVNKYIILLPFYLTLIKQTMQFSNYSAPPAA